MSYTLYPLVDDQTFLFPPQTMAALQATIGTDPDVIAAAVQAYLEAHPIEGATRVLFTQASPLSTWSISHSLGYAPTVDVFLIGGEQIDTDVISTPTQVTVTWPSPTSGFAVLI